MPGCGSPCKVPQVVRCEHLPRSQGQEAVAEGVEDAREEACILLRLPTTPYACTAHMLACLAVWRSCCAVGLFCPEVSARECPGELGAMTLRLRGHRPDPRLWKRDRGGGGVGGGEMRGLQYTRWSASCQPRSLSNSSTGTALNPSCPPGARSQGIRSRRPASMVKLAPSLTAGTARREARRAHVTTT